MPVLAKLPVTTITLPVCGAKVDLALSYGDKTEISRAVLSQSPVRDTESLQLTGDQAFALTKAVSERAVKSWDLTDESGQQLPVTWEVIGQLDSADGEYLAAEAIKAYSPVVDAPKGGKSRTS